MNDHSEQTTFIANSLSICLIMSPDDKLIVYSEEFSVVVRNIINKKQQTKRWTLSRKRTCILKNKGTIALEPRLCVTLWSTVGVLQQTLRIENAK